LTLRNPACTLEAGGWQPRESVCNRARRFIVMLDGEERMTTAAHLLYATAISVFLGLSIGFGAVTFFPDPDQPQIDRPPIEFRPPGQLTDEEHREELDDHRRNQLIGVSLLCALIIAVGVAVAGLPDALRLGAIMSGLGTMIWAVIYSGEHVGDSGIFATVFAMFLLLASLSHPALRRRVQAVARVSGRDSLLTFRDDRHADQPPGD
jgi:hypothetical protein